MRPRVFATMCRRSQDIILAALIPPGRTNATASGNDDAGLIRRLRQRCATLAVENDSSQLGGDTRKSRRQKWEAML